MYRALVGLGNIVRGALKLYVRPHSYEFPLQVKSTGIDAAQSGEITQCIRALPTTFREERVQGVSREIAALL